jgi:hypothetical protein
MRIETFLALLAGGAFFLPWVDLFGQSASGYQVLRSTLDLDGRMGDLAAYGDIEGGWVVYLFWAIPVGIVLTFVTGLAGLGSRLFALLTGLAPLVLLGLFAADAGERFDEFFRFFEVGLWATLGLALLLILAGLGLLRLPGRR